MMQHGKKWEHRGHRNKPGILKLIERMQQPDPLGIGLKIGATEESLELLQLLIGL